jgi:predicted  nucleic acid-binding Zn-ribbon protein
MGKMLAALMQVQSVERQLAHVRGRLRTRQNAVASQQRKIDSLTADWNVLHEKSVTRRKDADRLELDLRTREAEVSKYRAALNTAKTNKDYAAILTQINTLKADNSKLEEQILKIMQEVDLLKIDSDKLQAQVQAEQARLAEIERLSGDEIKRLTVMMDDLTAKRAEAAKAVPQEYLAAFDRIAANYDGDAMAAIEIHGKRPPHDFVCGGCFMQLNAEHVNALRTRDEIRTCDNCGRILYLETEGQKSAAN